MHIRRRCVPPGAPFEPGQLPTCPHTPGGECWTGCRELSILTRADFPPPLVLSRLTFSHNRRDRRDRRDRQNASRPERCMLRCRCPCSHPALGACPCAPRRGICPSGTSLQYPLRQAACSCVESQDCMGVDRGCDGIGSALRAKPGASERADRGSGVAGDAHSRVKFHVRLGV